MPLGVAEREIAHLLRRAGFGARRDEVARWAAQGRAATVDFLLNFEAVDNSALEAEVAPIDPWNHPDQIARWWLLRIAHTARPLEEKMVLFWHNHWACATDKVDNPLLMWQQNQLFRRLALPNWRTMCRAVSQDPAMLIYLDNASNRRGAPNENYAREFMELHTLGQDVLYTQADIREAARAFTGWSLDAKRDTRRALTAERDAKLAQPGLSEEEKRQIKNEYRLKDLQLMPTFQAIASIHDGGAKTFLGKTGNFDGDDVIEIVLGTPEAARFICSKLWNFFVGPGAVPEATLSRLTRLYFDTGYELKPVVREILLSDDFYAPKNYRTRTKSPAELLAGMLRQLEAYSTGTSLANATRTLGQQLFLPPNPAGWPGGKAWINASTLIGRANAAATTGSARKPADPAAAAKATDWWDPMPFIKAAGVSEAGQIVDLFLDLLVDGVATGAERNILTEYMHTDDAGNYRLFTLTEANVDKKVRGLVYLILSSPAHNLA